MLKIALKNVFFIAIVFGILCIFTTIPEIPSEPTPFENKPATEKYIIMFIKKASEKEMNEVKTQVIERGGFIYKEFNSIKAFAAEMPDTLVQVLDEDPRILSIEPDGPVYANTAN